MTTSERVSDLADSALEFARIHRVRLIAAGVLLFCILIPSVSAAPESPALLLSPIIVGAFFPLIAQRSLSGALNGWDEKFQGMRDRARTKEGKFARYFTRPLAGGSLWIWKRTESIGNEDVRAGARAASFLYFWGMMMMVLIMIVYMTIVIVMILLFLLLALWIIGHMLGGSSSGPSVSGTARSARDRLLNTRVVEEGIFGDNPTGMKVNEDGEFVKEGLIFDQPTGTRIDEDGRITRKGFFSDDPTGKKIDEEGRIVEEGFFGDHPTGKKIDEDGREVNEGFFGDNPTGKRYKKE